MGKPSKNKAERASDPDAGVVLHDLGVVRIRGADAVRYLQGQLSQNVESVSRERSLLSGFHNAQGRVIALLRLVRLADDELLAILPRELAAPVAGRLGRFVLRARVAIKDESNLWRVLGFTETGDDEASWPRGRNAQRALGDSQLVCVGESPTRWIGVSPSGSSGPNTTSVAPDAWMRHEIEAGEPQVFAATSEAFVSQMLNLDLVDAIAFDKGCYTGQEIIARTHYRGRIKRRMQRFTARTSSPLPPGTRGQLPDGRSLIVVRSVTTGDSVDFLAITSLTPAEEGAGGSAGADATLDASQQPLPYALPR